MHAAASAAQTEMGSNVMLMIDGKKHRGGSAVSATIIGLTDRMKVDGAVAILVPAGAPHERYIDKRRPGEMSQQYSPMMQFPGMSEQMGMITNVSFIPPYEGGDFEMRLFSNGQIENSTLLAVAPFSVTAEKEAKVTIALEKETYEPNSSVMVVVNNISERMVQSEAFIGLHKAGTGHTEPIFRKKLEKGENYVQIQLSEDIGGFEVRVFKDGTKHDDLTTVAEAKLWVKGITCPSCRLENQVAQKECVKCGTTLQPGKCSVCGYTDNRPEAEYCDICGSKRSA
jgi:hypothetical protein